MHLVSHRLKKEITFYEKIIKDLSILNYPVPSFIRKTYEYSIFHNKYVLTPEEMFSAPINLFLFFFIISILFYLIISPFSQSVAVDIFYGILMTGITLSIYLFVYPKIHEKIIKMRVTSESIDVITFLILYLRRVPNIENAFKFVVQYLDGYIPSDFDEILYGIMIKKYKSIDEGVNVYSRRWVEWNRDFAYAISLILYIRRIDDLNRVQNLLDRVLEWYIKSANERMVEYAAYLKPKVLIVATFFIMLPIVGILLIPILAIFLPNQVRISLIFYVYDVLLPILTFLFVQTIISSRPFAFSVPSLKLVPNIPKEGYFYLFGKEIPIFPLAFGILVLFLIPGINHLINLAISLWEAPPGSPLYIYIIKKEFSLFAILEVLSIIVGISSYFGIYNLLDSYLKVKIIRELEKLENELPLFVYLIENAAYSGIPIENALLNVKRDYEIVNPNGALREFITKIIKNIYMGISLRDAIFHPKIGAILFHPSPLLKEVMNLLVSAAEVSIETLVNIASKISYHLEKLKELKNEMVIKLSESISTLQLTLYIIIPVFGGIAMIAQKFIIQVFMLIIDTLKNLEFYGSFGIYDAILKEMVDLNNTIPSTIFVLAIGIFVVEISYVTAYLLSGIKYGFDATMKKYIIGKSMLIMVVILTIVIVIGSLSLESLIYKVP